MTDREPVGAHAPSRYDVLILPGINNSGPEHWQSHWERMDSGCRRLVQDEWDAPVCADWVVRLDEVLKTHAAPVVLAAHSSSCAMVAHWASGASTEQLAKVAGALLVAPSDPFGAMYPPEPTGFGPVPLVTLPFRTVVVTSTDDPYVSVEQAQRYASAWGSQMVLLDKAGHINAASGHGPWPQGFALLDALRMIA